MRVSPLSAFVIVASSAAALAADERQITDFYSKNRLTA